MHLAYADLLESNKRVPEAKELYERIVQHTQGNTLAYIHFLRFLRRTEVRARLFVISLRDVLCSLKATPGI